jgi:hypothetical protein
MGADIELTAEEASRMAVRAVTEDLVFWARHASIDGRIGLDELVRTLKAINASVIDY